MSTKAHACLVIHCDECEKPLRQDDLFIAHVDTIDDARTVADDEGWRFVGDTQICADCKYKPHTFSPEAKDSLVCERCDLDEDEHETAEAVAR